MKKQSYQELEQEARVMFDLHPEVQEFHVTEDGNFFPGSNRNYADTHAAEHKLRVITFTRMEIEKKFSEELESADEVIGEGDKKLGKGKGKGKGK